ncbi:sigma-70 family RNA polymerase sigma factor [Xinfangfangia sp. D13-10-4-6]|uniref:RNA polymerase sigma factor n=1 Tax=Pseudogemmobacter hezensis TaxID=2737662 RepID=UPI0015520895|nr:sigma-70 family RNA polymerase sigma factor [Pseudogemmobacter hezensis]NPD16984.1 sigma-70 family RNA polymerase sigma factor [Pseudogemmobacter hezensis]
MSSTDTDKIGQLYSEEKDRLERQIARRTGNPSIARDLVHDLFLRFWERTAAISGNPAAFLNRSARNISVDHLRRERVRQAYANTLPEADAPRDPAFETLSARQSQDAVKQAIRDLPETTRRLFLMNRAEGLTFQQIASRCGMSERNVAKHMAKAVAHCARALEDQRSE